MRAAMPEPTSTRSIGDEPLPGYRLIAPLGRGGFGEVWKCLAPGGLQKAIKFVAEDAATRAEGRTPLRTEYEAFLRVKGIRHPFLLMLERVELVQGELVMVMELADSSLVNRFDACRTAGLPGVPRGELLAYMTDAAEALDVLGRQHKLQHLDVKPANLFLVGGHVKVGDYGLVARFETGTPATGKLGRGLTPKYVAPEVLRNQIDPRSDQYTLALVYLELLTGSYPYDGTTAEQVLHQHAHAPPDLAAAPDGDRPALRRALSKHPAERFPSCLEFVKTLTRHRARELADTPAGIAPPPARVNSFNTPTRQHAAPPANAMAALDVTVPIGANLSAMLNATLRGTASGSALYGPAATRPGNSPAADDLHRAYPGYRLAGDVEHGPRGKVVRATDPAGRPFRVHTVNLGHGSGAEIETVLRAAVAPHPRVFQTVSVPHPRYVAFALPDDLPTLADRTRQSAAASTPVSRPELLGLFAAVAAALDDLHARTGFAHGLLNSSAVVAQPGKVGLTGYGVGELLRRTRPELDWVERDPHAAPEALRGEAGPASDQYALALMYLESLHAWTPAPRRPGSSPNLGINFGLVRDCEIPAVRKALATRPGDRHASCAAFVAALGATPTTWRTLDELRVVEAAARLSGDPPAAPPAAPVTPDELVEALFRLTAPPALAAGPVRQPDQRWACRFPVLLTADMLRMKLDLFREDNELTVLHVGPTTVLFRKPAVPGKPGAELTVELPPGSAWHAAEVTVHARPVGGLDAGGRDMPAALAELVDAFRRAVQPNDDRRRFPRRRADLAVTLVPLDDELRLGAPHAAQCRELSAGGFSCTTAGPPVTGHLFATFPGDPETAPWGILCEVVRTSRDPHTGHPVLAVRFLG